jgi:TRIAD3 protein (E3 ubiquitin-protein ligase RNF216)
MCFAAIMAQFLCGFGGYLRRRRNKNAARKKAGYWFAAKLLRRSTKDTGKSETTVFCDSVEFWEAPRECHICCEEFVYTDAVHCQGSSDDLSACHFFCLECIQRHAEISAIETPLAAGAVGLRCMEQNCSQPILYGHFYDHITPGVLQRLDDRILEETLASLPDMERCKKCRFPMETSSFEHQFIKCFSCEYEFCRICKRDLFPMHFATSCEELDAKEAREKAQKGVQEEMSEIVIRKCPKCSMNFVKQEGCNKMTCRCGKTQCYLCRATDIDYTHYCQHVREPGKPCKQCTKKCLIWENAEQKDEMMLKEVMSRNDKKSRMTTGKA